MANNTQAQEITAKLWNMANRLRGTMDASEYKNYILPFMFYRYLSAHQDEWLAQNQLEEFYELEADNPDIEDYLSDIVHSLGYAIEPQYRWERIIENIERHENKASDFQDMFDSFVKNVQRKDGTDRGLERVFADVNLGDTRLGSGTNERAKALNDVVLLVNDFEFKDENGHDILGDIYEYLIAQFASNAGKKGGEFYTPHEVSQILAKIVTEGVKVDDTEQFRVYDPAMGSGSLLLTVQKELPGDDNKNVVDFFGQELNTTTHNLARMNLMMHGVESKNMQLSCADTLGKDWPFDSDENTPRRFDAVVANPPYSQKWDIKNGGREKDPRFKFGVAPASKADYAFVLHGLHHLAPHGTMAIVLPHGVLFRGAAEAKIRKNIIDANLLDAVIGLPANIFYGTGIPTCVLVFKGQGKRETTDVLFIDASKEFEKKKNKNQLTEEHINKIIDTYRARKDVDKYAHLATLDEIKENDYNLNIPRYVNTFEEEEVTPLPDIAAELNAVQREIDEATTQLVDMLGQLEGTTDEGRSELEAFMKLLKQ